jgi:hypothetical protein
VSLHIGADSDRASGPGESDSIHAGYVAGGIVSGMGNWHPGLGKKDGKREIIAA